MNQDDFNYKALEQLKIIASRLESIERMLGEVEQEPEWHRKETAPDGKLVRITAGGFQVNLIGIKVEPNLWRAWKLNDCSNEVLFIPNVLVYSWRELNIEESAYTWENRILGASEEHAELSTLELPTAKREPEWRPMSTAPRDGTPIMGGFRDPHTPGGNICTEEPIYWRGGFANDWFYWKGSNLNRVIAWDVSHTLKGWRPL